MRAAAPGIDYAASVRAWLSDAVATIGTNLLDLEAKGNLKDLAKWEWFAREFQRGLINFNPQVLTGFGISLTALNWWPERKQPTTSLINFTNALYRGHEL
jgi:hypothetical protein